jgi:hypothetical protein
MFHVEQFRRVTRPQQDQNIRTLIKMAGVRKDRRADLSEIERLARKLEPDMAKAVLKALEQLRGSISLDMLAEALKSGDVGRVLALLDVELFLAGAADLRSAVNSAAWAGGTAAAAVIRPTIRGGAFAFDQLNPRLIQWLQGYSLGLIRQINDATKEGVRQALVSGMNAGRNPIDVAREIKPIIGLTERQAQAVQNFRKELETFHLRRTGGGYKVGGKIDRVNGRQVFRVGEGGLPMDGITERRLRDFRFDGQLARAMKDRKPLTQAQIDKMVDAYSRKYLRYRSEMIARTEAIRTTNIGVQDAWRQAIEANKVSESLVRRQWRVARDERTCEICSPVPSLNPKVGVEFGKPFQTPKGLVMLPPLHPSCRCTVFIRMWEPEQLKAAGF